ncbi:MAG TPA: AsmA-like C-terminal region-containing protein [Roseiarcus sp.]|nr:AsmA-like C-terminal region-containing protein [Roseiarcus sp.]
MRVVLTLLAVALVALLMAALIAPPFIDWSAHRADIEARLGAMTGGRVTLSAPITLRLLPVPYLDVGEGSAAGREPGAPQLSFKSARLELALAKLASGSIRFTEIRLEKPVLTLTRDVGGSLNLPAPPPGEADVVGFDRLVAHDGAVRILERAGGPARIISGVELDADAPALSGPYSASGRFDGPGGAPVVFRLATEKGDAAGTPIHVSVDAGPGWPALAFDGAFGLAGDRAKVPSVSGTATLIGSAIGGDGSFPWRVAGRLSANLDAAKLTNAEFRFGPDERALRAEGGATLAYDSSRRLTIRARAKQANVDALLRRRGEDGVAPARAVSLLVPALAPALAGTGGMMIDADVAAGDVILGSETMSDVSAKISAAPGAPLRARFDIGLPGRSRLKADGEIETGSAPKFGGAIDFSAGDLPQLLGWASMGAPRLAEKAAALGDAPAIRSASLSGDVQVSAVGFYGRSLSLTLERSTLTGSLALTGPVGVQPGRLYMDLSSDSLDVGALPALGTSEALLSDVDLSVSLRAKSLHIAHVGEGEINSGSLILKVGKSGPKTTLERLNVDDLGGASIDAEGSFGPEGATATGHLSANKLRDFALLVSHLAPAAWSTAVAERAPLLSPTFLTFAAKGAPAAGIEPSLESLRANGTIGQTHLNLAVDPAPKGGQIIAADLDTPESGALLRQLGVAGPTVSSGKAHLKLQAAGAWSAGYDVQAAGALAGADISASGRFVPTAEGDEARLFGSAKLRCANVVPFAASLGLAPSGGTIGPVEVGADVTLRGDKWTISRLSASIAGLEANGELAYEPPAKAVAASLAIPDLALAEQAINGPDGSASGARPPAITGQLAFNRLPLAGLLALALGPPQPAKAGSLWTEAKFAAAPLNPPPFALRVNAATLDAGDGLAARGFSALLRLDNGRLDLDDMAMETAGGAASGRVTLRRDRDSATLNGVVSAKRLAISRAGFSGRIDGTLEFASTGKSPAALIAGLAGSGSAQLEGAELARSDPASLDRVIARSQPPEAQLDETNIAYEFSRELDKASLKLPDSAIPLSLSAGVIKLGPLPIPRPHADAALNASFDLTKLSLETRFTLTSVSADLKFWSGPPPSATVTVQDALSAPKRKLDVASLSAGLATQAITRETDRIANLEADIRERAFFNRRLKGERFMERREQELEDWRAEQTRLKGLAEHLQSERIEKAATEKAAAAAAERAAAQKAAIDGAKADQAAAERRETTKQMPQPELPPDISGEPPLLAPPAAELGANAATPHAAPLPPLRPKPRPAPTPDRAPVRAPAAGDLY